MKTKIWYKDMNFWNKFPLFVQIWAYILSLVMEHYGISLFFLCLAVINYINHWDKK